jgi:hypothetical protein
MRTKPTTSRPNMVNRSNTLTIPARIGSGGLALAIWLGLGAPTASVERISHGVKESPEPVRIKISASDEKSCSGSCLLLQVRVDNTGDHPVAFDPAAIGYRISFHKLRFHSRGGSSESISRQSDVPTGEHRYRVLMPSDSYKIGIELPLRGRFFRDPGHYSVKVTYGQFVEHQYRDTSALYGAVDSNDLQFEISRCTTKESSRGCDPKKELK